MAEAAMSPEVTLTPRNEIFQLIIPNLAYAGKSLTTQLVLATVKDLCRVQTPDHQVSFDGWMLVAKDQLKWNDYCLQLFWDMLQAAVRYKEDMSIGWDLERDLLEIEYVAIFLALHIPDGTSRNTSPATAYDTMWPHESQVEESSSSPSRNNSPKGSPRKFFSIPSGTSSSPKSRSPRSSPNGSPTNSRPSSPKRFTPLSPRQSPRSNSQQVLCIRNKLPILIHVLALEELSSDFDLLGNELAMSLSQSISKSMDVRLKPKSLDCLGLIISTSREAGGKQGYRPLSEIFQGSASSFSTTMRSTSSQSLISGTEEDLSRSASADSIRSSTDGLPTSALDCGTIDGETMEVKSSAVYDWIENNISSTYSLSVTAEDEIGRHYVACEKPIKILEQLSTFARCKTVSVMEITSTFILITTSGPAVLTSPKNGGVVSSVQNGRYIPKASGSSTMSGSGSEGMSEEITDGEIMKMNDVKSNLSTAVGNDDGQDNWLHESSRAHPLQSLPQLVVENCCGGTIFLLAPFSSATISNCSNCEIVIGSVSRIVYLVGCEAVKLTVTSGKLIVRNCLDSLIHIASLSQTIICGDSRGLTFGPHNVSYKHLWTHMQMAGLSRISSISASKAHESDMDFDENVHCDVWSRVCDVSTCLESPPAASSPTGYAIDAAGIMAEPGIHRFLPKPPEVHLSS